MSDRISVLLVDDHVLFRSGLRSLLQFYEDIVVVGEAGHGDAALSCLPTLAPSVILMDVDMPGSGGIAATATIRASFPACRVLLLSGHRRFAVAGLQAGARGYVLKDADEDTIVHAIRTVHAGRVYLQPDIQTTVADAIQDGGAWILSDRDLAILRLLATGEGSRAIGDALGLSEHRIKQCIGTILEKLGAHDRVQAVAIALRAGRI